MLPMKGRGASSNATGRYEKETRHAFDDGWDTLEEPPPKLLTQVQEEVAKTALSWNDSPDISFDRAINPYRGCEHGCFYCYARPNHAYAGLSPGLDFETRLFAKRNVVEALRKELDHKTYQPAVIALAGVTDVYQPIEREHRLTRAILELLLERRHPATIVTKSALVLRDLDILAPMAERNLIKVAISLTTLDPKLARLMEPRAAAPYRRLEALKGLSEAGVPTVAMTAPLIPAINDHEIERLLEAAAEAGAREAGYVILRLPHEIKDLAREWLQTHFPDRAGKVIAQLQDMRGGRDYNPQWGVRQKGEGVYAQLIATRYRRACEALGLNTERRALDASQFIRAPGSQLDLFG